MPPKSAKQRAKEYRDRKKRQREENNENIKIPKSDKQRAKEYRERKKAERTKVSLHMLQSGSPSETSDSSFFMDVTMDRDSCTVPSKQSCKRQSDSSLGEICGFETKVFKKKSKAKTPAERARLYRERKRQKKFPNEEKKINLFKVWCDEKRRQDSIPKTYSKTHSKDFEVEDYQDQFGPRNLREGAFEFPILGPDDSAAAVHKATTARKIPYRTIAPSSTEICSSTAMVNTVQTPLLWIVTDSPGMGNSTYNVSANTQKNEAISINHDASANLELQFTTPDSKVTENQTLPESVSQSFRCDGSEYPWLNDQKNESTSVNPDVLANLEVELTTPDSPSDQEMKIKEEPMSEPEEGGAAGYQNVYTLSTLTDTVSRLGTSTVIVPSVHSVKSHSERSSGEILGVPVGELPRLPGAPPSESVSGDNLNPTNGVLKKNRLQPNPNFVNKSGKETMPIKEEPMSEPEEGGALGYQKVNDPSTITDTVSRLGASTVIVPSVLSVKSLSERSSGDILGVPVGGLLRAPGAPPSQIVSGHNLNPTNGVLKKNRLQSNPNLVNESGEEKKAFTDYKTRDQFDVFGKYIASKLRKLDWKTCARVQKAVDDIISQAEMENYNQVNESCP